MHWLSPYGSEVWTLKNNDTKRLTSIEKNFFRRTTEQTVFGHKRDEEILEESGSRTS
jgi:hypothetical protein